MLIPFLVADTRLYTLPCRSVRLTIRPSVTFLNSERFLQYCSCPTVRNWPRLGCRVSGFVDLITMDGPEDQWTNSPTDRPMDEQSFMPHMQIKKCLSVSHLCLKCKLRSVSLSPSYASYANWYMPLCLSVMPHMQIKKCLFVSQLCLTWRIWTWRTKNGVRNCFKVVGKSNHAPNTNQHEKKRFIKNFIQTIHLSICQSLTLLK